MKTKDTASNACIFKPISYLMFRESNYAQTFKFACSIDLLTRNCDLEQIKKILVKASLDPNAQDEVWIKAANKRIAGYFMKLSKDNPELFSINSMCYPHNNTLYPVIFFEEQLQKINAYSVTSELINLFLEKIREQKQIALNDVSNSNGFFVNKYTLHKMVNCKSTNDNVVFMTKDELKRKRENNFLSYKTLTCHSQDTVMKGNKRMDETPSSSCNKIRCLNQKLLEPQGTHNVNPTYGALLDFFYKDVTGWDKPVHSTNESAGGEAVAINTGESVSDNALDFSMNEVDFFKWYYSPENQDNSPSANDNANQCTQDPLEQIFWN